ncbi:MAG: ATP-binding protein [Gammaproteobacteria bacterium]|nr:ATP-binding protein [Gammaproteobacteria bacterium]
MPGTLTVRLANRLDELQRLDTALSEFNRVENLSPDVVMQIQLALEELFTNIVSYGYDDDEKHEVEIRIACRDNSLTIDMFDDGKQFDPLAERDAVDMDQPLEDIQIGGHGINLVKAFMNELTYNYTDGRNHLSMARHL